MSNSWGWKLATTPDDVMNFLNGTGSYKTPVKDAKICAVQCVVFGLLVGVEALKTVSLEGLSEKFSRRVSELPLEFQAVFLEDLETAIVARLKVLEGAV